MELPDVRNLRVDMLGETASGELVHIELQSGNDSNMPLRMAEYALAIFRKLGRFPHQVVVYAGNAPPRMPHGLDSACITSRYRLADVHEMDAEPMLASPLLDDNVMAILMNIKDRRSAVRAVLGKIANAGKEEWRQAFRELGLLAGLRSLGAIIEEETTNMPILNDIMDHDRLGPAIRRGMEEGRKEGREEGLRETLEQLSTRRFGPSRMGSAAYANVLSCGPATLHNASSRRGDA